MLFGAHYLLFSADADADRAFIRDVLGLNAVDGGRGCLIFTLPPAEMAVHPADGAPEPGEMARQALYFMCENLESTMAEVGGKGVSFGEVQDEPWGIHPSFDLPSGAKLGLYQPKHELAIKR